MGRGGTSRRFDDLGIGGGRFLALVLLVAVGASAQPSKPWSPCVEDPVVVLLAGGDGAACSTAGSDMAPDELERAPWSRVDPQPEAPANELREDFEARVRAADHQFSSDVLRGACTHRGRTLLLLGAPERRFRVPIATYLDTLYRDAPSGGSHPSLGGIGYDPLNHTPTHRHGVVVVDLTRDVAAGARFMEGNDPDGTTLRHGVRFHLRHGVVEVWEYAGLVDAVGGARAIEEPFQCAFLDPYGTGAFHLEPSLRGGQRCSDEMETSRCAVVAAASRASFRRDGVERIE